MLIFIMQLFCDMQCGIVMLRCSLHPALRGLIFSENKANRRDNIPFLSLGHNCSKVQTWIKIRQSDKVTKVIGNISLFSG